MTPLRLAVSLCGLAASLAAVIWEKTWLVYLAIGLLLGALVLRFVRRRTDPFP